MQQHASAYTVLTQAFDPWGWVIAQNIFSDSSHVAYHIRRELSIEHHANTYYVLTHHLNPGAGSKVKPFFLTVVMLHVN